MAKNNVYGDSLRKKKRSSHSNGAGGGFRRPPRRHRLDRDQRRIKQNS